MQMHWRLFAAQLEDSHERSALSCCSYAPPQQAFSAAHPSDASVEERAARLAGGSTSGPTPKVPVHYSAAAAPEQVLLPDTSHGSWCFLTNFLLPWQSKYHCRLKNL